MNHPNLAIGTSVDVHRFKAGLPLVLGGLPIAHPFGLEAHSDGDVLLHAVLDAILSAADLPDLGTLFPDSDESQRGRSSVEMAREVVRRLKVCGARVLSVDSVLLCEAPRISPLREQIRAALAAALDLKPAQVNVKGKTYEKLGPIGSGECIEARAVALVERAPSA